MRHALGTWLQSVSIPEASPRSMETPVMLYAEVARTAWERLSFPRWPAKARLTREDMNTRAACRLMGPPSRHTLRLIHYRSERPSDVGLVRTATQSCIRADRAHLHASTL